LRRRAVLALAELGTAAPLGAVCLLVFNDNHWKGLFHNAFTGKLFDVAICFLLLAVVYGRRRFAVAECTRSVSRSAMVALVMVAGSLALTACFDRTPGGRDCFPGLGTKGTIQVVIGGPTDMRRYKGGYPSCAGADGLQPGTTVTLTLSKDSPAPCAVPRCNSYGTTSAKGLVGVAVEGEGDYGPTGCDAFAYVRLAGAFFVDPASGCSGSWEMDLAPAIAPAGMTTLSPFDAGPVQQWVIWRRIGIVDDGQAVDCPVPTGVVNVNFCEDEFVVQSITKLSP
jgi:hypothetical protein